MFQDDTLYKLTYLFTFRICFINSFKYYYCYYLSPSVVMILWVKDNCLPEVKTLVAQ